MKPIDLANRMRRLYIHLAEQRAEPDLIRRLMPNPPFEEAYLQMEPARQTPFPSSNPNCLYLRGCAEGDTPDFLNAMTRPFQAHGVEKFFVSVSPGPRMERMRSLLTECGYRRFGGTGYPTLVRLSNDPAPYHTDFVCREIESREANALSAALDTTIGPDSRADFLRTVGRPGYHKFAAFADNLPVAVGTLTVFEGMGYLQGGVTAPAYRRHGAQSALIAARIDKARAQGCTFCTSETLYMLTSSYHNLCRAGFEEAYEKEVYNR